MPGGQDLRDPWLVAVWPGMGSVAYGGGRYLVEKLGADLVHELATDDLFEVQHVDVNGGLATPARLPRQMFFEWRDPDQRRDLLVFIGEAQPVVKGPVLCRMLLDYAASRGVKRLFTFAAMSTQLHPSKTPRVFAVATDGQLLDELRRYDVVVLTEGQISGLNGVLLTTGMERGIAGACLLGEMPFFAANVENPKASLTVLEVFTALFGVEIDTDPLRQEAQVVDEQLTAALERMEGGDATFSPEPEEDNVEEKPELDGASRRRLEQMFGEATVDRSKAAQLKAELDRLGVYEEYEDRFLDLFRRGE
jgi:proteasome assembly chaperone (PAC2) family protein